VIVFFDACALIYLLEGNEPFASNVRQALATIAGQHPDLAVAVSRLSWLECRVGPMKRNDNPLLAQYDAFFSRPDLIWVELSRDVVELATAIRVKHGIKTPDALQAASCLQLGNNHLFLSGDREFQRVAGLHMHLLT
jgi:predicted nucleic acid-binding protein